MYRMSKREKEAEIHMDPCVFNCNARPSHLCSFPQQLEERAKRHRPWPHTDWLSSNPSKGIKGTDGAVLYPEENEDDTSLQDR